MTPSGRYDQTVEIQSNHPTLDSSRRKVDDWRLFCRRRARKEKPVASSSVVITEANRSDIRSETLFVRKDSRTIQIDSNYQLLWRSKVWKIEAAIEQNDEIELTVKAREFSK